MGIFDFLFGVDENDRPGQKGSSTVVDRDKKGNQKRVTRKDGKVTNVTYVSSDGVKHRNEQAMQDYLRRNGGGR